MNASDVAAGRADEPSGNRKRRFAPLLPILLGVGGGLLTWWLLVDGSLLPASLADDGGAYLYAAQEWLGVEHGPDRHRTLPELYSMLVAIVAHDSLIPAARLVNLGSILMGWVVICGLIWQWLPARWRVWGIVMVLTLPATWLLATAVASEHLYVGLSLAACGLLTRCERVETNVWRYAALAGACAGLAFLTRSIGLVLLAAPAIWVLDATRRRLLPSYLGGAVLAVGGGALVGLPLFGSTYGAETAYSMAALDGARLLAMPSELLKAWMANLAILQDPGLFLPLSVACIVPGAIAAWATVRRALARESVAVYVGGFALVVLIWGFDREAGRLLYPIVPILLLWGLAQARRWGGVRLGAGFIGIVLVAHAVGLHRLYGRTAEATVELRQMTEMVRVDRQPIARRLAAGFHAVLTDFHEARYLLPEGARVACLKPQFFAAASGRACLLPPRDLDAASWIRDAGIDYAYLSPLTRPDRPPDVMRGFALPCARPLQRTAAEDVLQKPGFWDLRGCR